MKVLVTGATGYIGSKLVPLLIDQGHEVRVSVRSIGRLAPFDWKDKVAACVGDVGDASHLNEALSGIEAAFYLIHSMGSGPDFHQRDVTIAEQFGRIASENSVQTLVYLGALGHEDTGLTEHLRSRHETGLALAASGVPVIELRAGPVVGAGSLPFEMIRYLTERVPVMICPRWVFTQVQPIGLDDVLSYLAASLDVPPHGHQIVEIGGSKVLSYGEMMTGYAKVRGLRRIMIRVPVLTPRLSSLWVHLITPLRGSFARPIVEGLRNEVVVRSDAAQKLFPAVAPLAYEAAVARALEDTKPENLPPRVPPNDLPASNEIERSSSNLKGLITQRRRVEIEAPPSAVFDAFTKLGGQHGWHMNLAWSFRGALDRLVGGPGLRKGRPEGQLSQGDKIDFWTVEKIVPESWLRLKADMRLPGEAWLEFFVSENGAGRSSLLQTSYFAPKGLIGTLYWLVLLPIHNLIFDGLARHIADLAKPTSDRS